MKRLLLSPSIMASSIMASSIMAASILALTAGGAFAQGYAPSPGMQPPSATQPPPMHEPMMRTPTAPTTMPSTPAPSTANHSFNGGTMGRSPGSAAMNNSTMPRAYHSNSEVVAAQSVLKRQGLYHGRVDGKIGPKTKAAIAKFQKENGLHQTARLDRRTMHELLSMAGTGSYH